ncbi:DUF4245 domain-containing protein [Actinokineospora auranticolor]|uniref:Uncharacterized protein DUF4245 n=1 Tax=Actinokineospora auranticolor TaxID=155976 RepID=A0A2S6GYI6_9PSEU|nr:DUF4245 domain-containing protein [Actinokineospora auranticolor]PPK70226.1 uncharacterized protein DUF4245 [Actinokineospora auranticolor]
MASNRLTHGPRDMLLSLLALLVIIGAILFLNRGCSFSPGTPVSDPATAPKVDVAASLSRAKEPFRVRVPAVPEGWRGNSFTSGKVEPSGRVVRAGWLTPEKFMQLSQSDADIMPLVASETGEGAGATGTVDVSGTQWTVFPGRRAEKAWVADVDGVRLLITGTGSENDFRTLATASTA